MIVGRSGFLWWERLVVASGGADPRHGDGSSPVFVDGTCSNDGVFYVYRVEDTAQGGEHGESGAVLQWVLGTRSMRHGEVIPSPSRT